MKNNIKLSICIDALYAGRDLEQSVINVLDNGFTDVEFWGWENKNIKELKRIKENTGIEIVALCTGFISLTDPSKRKAYLESLKQTIEIADELYHSEIDYKSIFSVIKETPYQGYIGLEYFPEEDVTKGLSYAKQIFME